MKKHHIEVLIEEAQVHRRIAELGVEISRFYQQQNIDKLIEIGRAHV